MKHTHGLEILAPLRVGLATILAVACASGPGAPSGGVTATPSIAAVVSPSPLSSPSPEASSAPEPVCFDRHSAWVDDENRVHDGVTDPAGRIVFGSVNRGDPILGQHIAPLFAMDADGSDLAQIFDCEVERPRISPDGTRIAFAIVMDDESLQIATIAADGSDLRILTATSGYADTPDWSPDGTWLVYATSAVTCSRNPLCESLNETLWRMNADGSDQHLIGNDVSDAWDYEPRLSPDGHEVVFARNTPETGYRWTLMIRSLDTGQERPAKVDTRDLEHPDWSRDGRFIIYHASPNGPIERVPADDPDAAPEILTGDAADPNFYKPAYSPDGRSLVFGCAGKLCTMGPDGKIVVVIDAPGVELNHFDWGVNAP